MLNHLTKAKSLIQVIARRSHTARYSLPSLTLFTKDNCSLCDEAKIELEPYADQFELEEIYINHKGNEHWFEQYKFDIPVFHLNGQYLMKHHVHHKALQTALEKLK